MELKIELLSCFNPLKSQIDILNRGNGLKDLLHVSNNVYCYYCCNIWNTNYVYCVLVSIFLMLFTLFLFLGNTYIIIYTHDCYPVILEGVVRDDL